MQRTPLVLSLAGLAAVALAAFDARGGFGGDGVRYALGALLGGFAGFALYHARFGFTAAYRRLVRERRGAGLRAQTLLLGATAAVTYPLIGFEGWTGWDMHPVIMPMTLASALGAFLFGLGMQIGGGCASGTLYTAGGGSTRMVVTLLFFIIGSAWATLHVPGFWMQLDEMTGVPNIPGTSLIALLGPLGGLAALMALLAGVWLLSVAVERGTHGTLQPLGRTESWLAGQWSLTAGAVALALVGVGSFLLFQRPWGVTSGFALWGAKLFQIAGIGAEDWTYWQGWRGGVLAGSVFADRISVMNFGIVFGAMTAAAAAGRFRPTLALPLGDLATAAAGGLMMGYGARLSFGCNIGAFLGGVVSGSLHGWWWLVWGFAGSTLGTWCRIRLRVDPPIARMRPQL